MSLAGTVLIVDDDAASLGASATVLRGRPGLRVLTAASGQEALEAARVHRPDLVLIDLRKEGMDGTPLIRAVKSDRALDGTLTVLVTAGPDPRESFDDALGADDVLITPVAPRELIGKVGAMLRLKRLHDQLRADKLELERLHRTVAERLQQLLGLLVHLVDLRVPGAAARGAEGARLCALLAERFEVPPVLRRDLDIAARLHEIGKVLLDRDPLADEGPEDPVEGDHWRYVVAARELLEQTVGFEAAAELIGGVFENWDGTGHPARLRQGQIPLRTRMLRVVNDYQMLLERGQAPGAAVEHLNQRAGTWYDPLAVAYLDAIVRAAGDARPDDGRVRVPVSHLAEGMTLADDLCTSGGVKLLAKGARLTRTHLDTIFRRHRSDPIVHGVWIRRPDPGLSAGGSAA